MAHATKVSNDRLSRFAGAAISFGLILVLLAGPAQGDQGEPRFDAGRLWRISKTGVADSFVFGTIHAADRRVATIPPQVRAAMRRTQTLATEVAAVALPEAVRLIGVPADDRDVELSDPATDRLKPWAAMLRATADQSSDGVTSLDEQLLALATAQRMRVLPLEAPDEQAASFDAIPLASQAALLDYALAHRETLAATREDAIAAWLRGDIATLARIPNRIAARHPDLTPHYRALIRHIIVNRTAVMHYRSFMPLRRGGVLVAVGASHLHGEQGLLNLLREDGYRLTRVW
jgi:uncharacterized protein